MIPALLAALAAGLVWTLHSPRRAWFLMVPSMGGALWLAFASLLPAPVASVVLLVLSGVAWWRGRAVDKPESDPPVRAGVVFLLVVLGLASWWYPVGVGQLQPGRAYLVQEVPLAGAGGLEHPLGPAAAPSLATTARLMASTGLDPFLAGGLLAGVFQVMALLLIFSGILASTGAWLPALLGTALVFGWGEGGWLLTVSPGVAAAHLLTAAALASAVLNHRLAAAGFASLVFLYSPPLGWTAALALLGLELWNERRPLVSLLPVIAGLSQGVWPAPAPPMASQWTVLALFTIASQSRWVRAGLCLEVASWLAGGPVGCGAALAVGVAAGEWLAERWRLSEPGRFALARSKGLLLTVPRRFLVGVAVFLLLYAGLLPGESRFNDDLLIAAHKRGVDLLELARPVALETWAQGFPELSGLSELDLEAADSLRSGTGPFLVLTPGAPVEPLVESALLSTLTGRPVAGWHANPKAPELLPPLAVARATGSLAPLAQGPASQVLVREPDETLVLEVPPPTPGGSGELTAVPAPGVPVPWTAPTTYQVEKDGAPWGWEVQSGALFLLPTTPGEYSVRLPDGSRLGPWASNLPATLENLEARLLPLPEKPPSRSLVPVRFELFNPGPSALSTALFQGAVVTAFEPLGYERTSFPQPLQPLPDLLLAAGEKAVVELWVTTPEPEGAVPLRLELVDFQGQRFRAAMEPPAILRTWRRLPPVGTWE